MAATQTTSEQDYRRSMRTLLIQRQPDSLAVSGSETGHLRAVLLAGGDGIRMQALTRRISGDSRPKQFCPIVAKRRFLSKRAHRPTVRSQPSGLCSVSVPLHGRLRN